MKVRTLKLFNDLQSKKLRKVNEIFEVTAKRVEEINSTRYGTLVEVIEEDKIKEKANPIKTKDYEEKVGDQMALIDDVKDVLRESGAESNTEIQDLIDFAKVDMKSVGILESKIIETDMMIKRAINLYCKANFSYEEPKIADRFQKQYDSLKTHLALSSEYTEVVV